MEERTQTAAAPDELTERFEESRRELTGYAYRMLGSAFEAEDAVQETYIRAWRGYERFEGRAALRSWLYRIATNVCLDMLGSRERRARPMDLGPAREPVESNLRTLPEVTWIEPMPTGLVVADGDPAEIAVARESVKLAFVAALQHLPPRQRAVLVLCEVLRWQASEVAELLDTSVASVNSALQRARATLEAGAATVPSGPSELAQPDQELLERYVKAFEAYDMEALTSLIQEDAQQSMPPFDLWLSGRDDILTWWFGPGIGCQGSRVVPTVSANGSPAFGQYKPAADGGYEPWALQVLEIEDGRIVEFTFFLDTADALPALRPAAPARRGARLVRSGRRSAPSGDELRTGRPRRCAAVRGSRRGRRRAEAARAHRRRPRPARRRRRRRARRRRRSRGAARRRGRRARPGRRAQIGPRIANATVGGASAPITLRTAWSGETHRLAGDEFRAPTSV